MIFIKNSLIYFHINNTSIIRLVKQNKPSFSSNEIKKSLTAPSPQCLTDQIEVHKPFLVVATDEMTDHTKGRH